MLLKIYNGDVDAIIAKKKVVDFAIKNANLDTMELPVHASVFMTLVKLTLEDVEDLNTHTR